MDEIKGQLIGIIIGQNFEGRGEMSRRSRGGSINRSIKSRKSSPRIIGQDDSIHSTTPSRAPRSFLTNKALAGNMRGRPHASAPKRQRRATYLGTVVIACASCDVSAFIGVQGPAQNQHVLRLPRGTTTTTKMNVQLPTQNEQERALNDMLLQIAIQNGDEEAILQQRERRLAEQAGRDTAEEDWAVLQPTFAFAGGMSLIVAAAVGAYALSNGLVSVGAGPAL